MSKYSARFLINILAVSSLLSCASHSYKWNYNDGIVALFKKYKFYDGQSIDSAFYHLYIGKDSLGLCRKYVDEKVKRIKLETDDDALVIKQFLYSLEVYNTMYMSSKTKPIQLYRNHFFKNKIFKKKYEFKYDASPIILLNLEGLEKYNFKDMVRYDTINNFIHMYFPPSSCELIFPLGIFEEVIYPQRLECILNEKQRLGNINISVQKMSW